MKLHFFKGTQVQVSPSGWAGAGPAFVLSWQKRCQGRTIWSFVPAGGRLSSLCPSQVKGCFSFGPAGVKAAPVLAVVGGRVHTAAVPKPTVFCQRRGVNSKAEWKDVHISAPRFGWDTSGCRARGVAFSSWCKQEP